MDKPDLVRINLTGKGHKWLCGSYEFDGLHVDLKQPVKGIIKAEFKHEEADDE